jgi:hypothetical protein
VGQGRVHQQLHAADHLRDPLRLGPGGLLAKQLLALLLLAAALGDVADEGWEVCIAADDDLRHGGLDREARAVASHGLDLGQPARHLALRLGQLLPALVVVVPELGRNDQRAHRAADRLGGAPTEHPLCGGIPGGDDPVAVQGHECVRRAVEYQSGARLGPAELTRTPFALDRLGPEPCEQPRDQQARDRRRAHCQQPARRRAGMALEHEEHPVGRADEREVCERQAQLEEVEREEGGPGEHERIQRRGPRVVVREGEDQRARRHGGVELPVRHPLGAPPGGGRDREGDQGEDHQRGLAEAVVVRQRQGEQAHGGARGEEVGQRAGLEAAVEQV